MTNSCSVIRKYLLKYYDAAGYLIIFGFVLLGGLRFKASFLQWRLLDQGLLENDALESIWLMHSQPPLFNTLTAFILKAGRLLHVSWAHLAFVVYIFLGLAAVRLLRRTLEGLELPARAVPILTGLFLLNPSLYYYLMKYNDAVPALLFTTWLLYAASKWFKEKSGLWQVGLALVGLANLRPQYHPVYLLLLFIGMLWLQKEAFWRSRKSAVIIICTMIGLFIWPVKNYVHYEIFQSSSWVGYNLSRPTPLRAQFEKLFWSEQVLAQCTSEQMHPSVRDVFKASCPEKAPAYARRNWNHMFFVRTQKELAKKSIEWRLNNMPQYIRFCLLHYCFSTQPGDWVCYNGKTAYDDCSSWLRGMVSLHRSTVFADLRKIFPFTLVDGSMSSNITKLSQCVGSSFSYVGISLYGAVILPLLLLSVMAFLISRMRSGWDRLDSLACFGLLLYGWLLLTTCAVDGVEGTRMLFPSVTILVIFSAYLIVRFPQVRMRRTERASQ